VSDAFAAAIEYHRSHETRWRRDFLTDDGRYIGVADEPRPSATSSAPCGRVATPTA